MTTPDHAHPAEPAERASWLWRRLGIAYVLVIVLCIGLYLHGRWEGVLTALQEPAPGLMGCTILAAVLAYLLQARAFVTIQLAVEAPTRPVPVRNWLYLFFHGYFWVVIFFILRTQITVL